MTEAHPLGTSQGGTRPRTPLEGIFSRLKIKKPPSLDEDPYDSYNKALWAAKAAAEYQASGE